MNVITEKDYDPYKYFAQMTKKYKHNWHALFLVPNKRAKTKAMRTLFELLENDGMPCSTQITSGRVKTTVEGSMARFVIAFKGITDNLAGTEYQQIDGTDLLDEREEEKIRGFLRTTHSIALAKDMIVR